MTTTDQTTTRAAQHLIDTFGLETGTARQIAGAWATARAAALAESPAVRRFIAQDLLTDPRADDLEGLRRWHRNHR